MRRIFRRAEDPRVRRLSWGVAIATASALTAYGLASWQAQAAPSPGTPAGAPAGQLPVSDPDPVPEGAAGNGRDPLTGAEAERARTVAMAAVPGTPADVTGARGAEPLTTSLTSGAQGRRAEVLLYDYATDKLVKQVVDVTSGTVTKTFSASGMQPPASPREVGVALDLLLAGPHGDRLKDAYRTATGSAYTGAGQIEVRAHVHTARPADKGAEKCGAHRCVSLVVQVKDGGAFLDLNDIIIDLSGRTVARLS